MPHAMIAARRGSHPLLPTATERLVVCWKRRPLPTLLHSFLWAGRHSLHSLIQEQVLTGDSTPVSSSSLLSFHSLSSSAHPLSASFLAPFGIPFAPSAASFALVLAIALAARAPLSPL